MKKFIVWMLVAALMLSLCACAQEKTNVSNKGGNDSGTSQNNSQNTQSGDSTQEEQSKELTSIADITFTVNETKFHLGMKLSELMDSGVFTRMTARKETLEAIENTNANIYVGERKLVLYLWNLSREQIDVEDATVVGVEIIPESKGITEVLKDISFAGVKLDDSIDSVISVFGEPNVHEQTSDTEGFRSAGWRGFDIGEEFRLYIHANFDKSKQEMVFFSLFFRPFTDNIK